jgi:hypothetical protein
MTVASGETADTLRIRSKESSPMRLKNSLYSGLAAAVTAGALGAVVGPATPALAVCDGPKYTYTTSSKSLVLVPGNYKTDWADPEATVSISKGRTTTWTVGGTLTGKTEVSAILAKAEASLAISLTYSWSNTNSQTISQKVPKGNKQGRLRRYADGYKFKVTKKRLTSPCDYVVDSVSWTTAPKEKGDTSVVMEYRKKPPIGAASVEDETPQPIEL